jgi:predicted Zn-dependent protease
MWALTLALIVFGIASADTEKERMLGQALATEYERRATLVADPAVTQYLDGLARKLAAHADLPCLLVVKVLEAGEPRAVPLPGGFFYLTSGLILRAESESELAAILAHGIGHIALWIRTRPAPDAPKSATIPLVFVGGDSGLCLRLATPSLVPPALRANAQSREESADQLALEYLSKTNYDPNGLPSIFDKLDTPIALIPPFVPDSVVSTAAFDRAKARLSALALRPKPPREKPSLRRR